jgi:hypothetical protein
MSVSMEDQAQFELMLAKEAAAIKSSSDSVSSLSAFAHE